MAWTLHASNGQGGGATTATDLSEAGEGNVVEGVPRPPDTIVARRCHMSVSEDGDADSAAAGPSAHYSGTLDADWLPGLEEAAPPDNVTAAAEAERRTAGRFSGLLDAAAAAPAAAAAAVAAAAGNAAPTAAAA